MKSATKDRFVGNRPASCDSCCGPQAFGLTPTSSAYRASRNRAWSPLVRAGALGGLLFATGYCPQAFGLTPTSSALLRFAQSGLVPARSRRRPRGIVVRGLCPPRPARAAAPALCRKFVLPRICTLSETCGNRRCGLARTAKLSPLSSPWRLCAFAVEV